MDFFQLTNPQIQFVDNAKFIYEFLSVYNYLRIFFVNKIHK